MSLFLDSRPPKFLYVGNPVTMQYERLPLPTVGNEILCSCRFTFVPRTWEYKVVSNCVRRTGVYSGVHRWLVLTVGIDKLWRKLDTTIPGSNFHYLEWSSVSVGGVLYWSRDGGIYAIDLLDETSYFIHIPNELRGKMYWLLELGDSLSCVKGCWNEVHVFKLKNLYHSEWDKLYKIRDVIDTQRFASGTFMPVGWLDNGQTLVFVIENLHGFEEIIIVAYDMTTGETMTAKVLGFQRTRILTNSLVSLEALYGTKGRERSGSLIKRILRRRCRRNMKGNLASEAVSLH